MKAVLSIAAATAYALAMLILAEGIYRSGYWGLAGAVSTLFLCVSPLYGVVLFRKKGKLRLTLLTFISLFSILANTVVVVAASLDLRDVQYFNESIRNPAIATFIVAWILMWAIASIFPLFVIVLEFESRIYPRRKVDEKQEEIHNRAVLLGSPQIDLPERRLEADR
jgi:hypothetical protein